MSDALLPCPFCGGEAKGPTFTGELGRWDIYEVECPNCHIAIESELKNEGKDAAASAIAAWNTRLAHSPAPAQDGENVVEVARAILIKTITLAQERSSNDWGYFAEMIERISDAQPARIDSWLALDAVIAALSTPPDAWRTIDMVLHCPVCTEQHIDEPTAEWANPPHRSHLCLFCGHIWRPADVPTNGVAAIQTRGRAASPAPPQAPSTPAGEG